MRRAIDKTTDRRGTTLVELTVAVAIIATVFAAIMPLFAGIRNSTGAQWANLEMVQTARVLNEQLCRCLAPARRIVDVSSSTSDDGHIQFEGADGVIYRCNLDTGGCVEFGPVGDLSELVGPVEYLRFVCYDGNDLSGPAQTPDGIRLVTWEVGLRSLEGLTRDKIVRGACYLRVAAQGGADEQTSVTYDFVTSRPGVDSFAFADQGEPQVPDEPGIPAALLATDQYSSLAADDEQTHTLQVADGSRFAQLRVTFQIDEDPRNIAGLAATWIGRGVNSDTTRTDGAALYIWNYDSSRYELLQASPNTEAEVTLTGSGHGAAGGYVGGADGKTVMLLVVSNDRKAGQQENTLFTDYVKVDVTTSPGGGVVVP